MAQFPHGLPGQGGGVSEIGCFSSFRGMKVAPDCGEILSNVVDHQQAMRLDGRTHPQRRSKRVVLIVFSAQSSAFRLLFAGNRFTDRAVGQPPRQGSHCGPDRDKPDGQSRS